MPAPKMGASISSSSLLTLSGPVPVGNATGDPGMLQKILVGEISGKCIGEGPNTGRWEQLGKHEGDPKKSWAAGGKGAAGSCHELQHARNSKWEYKPCLEILCGREVDLQPNPRGKRGSPRVVPLFKLPLTFTLSNVSSPNPNIPTELFPNLSFAFPDEG